MPFHDRNLIVNYMALGILKCGLSGFSHCAYRWHFKVDAILKGILKSLASNTPLLATEDIIGVLTVPTFISLFFRTSRATILLEQFVSSTAFEFAKSPLFRAFHCAKCVSNVWKRRSVFPCS